MGSVNHLYILLETCKQVGLLHSDFHHRHSTAPIVTQDINSNKSELTDNIPPKPDVIPFTPLEESVPQLEERLFCHFSASAFNTNRSPLPVMAGRSHQFYLIQGVKPYARYMPALVPAALEAEVKRQLDEDIARGVTEPVPVSEATVRCSRMVVVVKNV